MPQQNRQLAAILFTDIIGYTAMMQQDEGFALTIVKRYLEVLQTSVAEFAGKIHNDYGDGSLCSFSSATQAIQCAIEIQKQLQQNPPVALRIGLHVGEIFFEGEKVLGDGVNVASRIQSLGQANTILFSKEFYDKIKNQPEFKIASLGFFEFKNVDEPMEVFALANDGLKVPKKEEMSGKLKEPAKKSNKKSWIIAAAILIIFFAIAAIIFKYTVGTAFTGKEKSIAVMPFENSGADKTEDYVSDGITQDIISNLSKISSLQKVIGWFSVRRFKGSVKSVKEIADELGVEALLTGTMEKQADNIHVIAELIDVNTNKKIWGEDYNYSGKDILSIQSNVALQIVTHLRASMTPDEKKGLSKHYTENVDAYKYYIRGRTLWNTRSKKNFDSAELNFRRAIDLDPQYALAYAGLADCYTYNLKGMPQLEGMPFARAEANRALSIDSNLSEGLTTLGFIHMSFDYDWDGAKRVLEKAISLDPNNSTAHMYYGMALQYTGHTEEGLKEQEKAVALDPLAWSANWVLGRNYFFAKRYDDAIKQLTKTEQLGVAINNSDACYQYLGLVYLAKNMQPQALAEYAKIPDNFDDRIENVLAVKSYGYAATGDKEKAILLVEKAIKQDPYVSVYRIAQVYVAIGDINKALDYLEEGYRKRELHMFWINSDPSFDPIRNEPRFMNLLRNMSLLK